MRLSEVAVSLNSKDVQIFARQGSDWTSTETLSEVCMAITLQR